jgi:hypothetical protein
VNPQRKRPVSQTRTGIFDGMFSHEQIHQLEPRETHQFANSPRRCSRMQGGDKAMMAWRKSICYGGWIEFTAKIAENSC